MNNHMKANIGKKAILVQARSSEDWKTALAHSQRHLDKGEEVEITGVVRNLYGEYYTVKAADGQRFQICDDDVRLMLEANKSIVRG